MTNRSPERTNFLADVLVTAIEGGVNYWAGVTEYHTSEYLEGPKDPSTLYAVLVDQTDEDDDTRYRVDLATIAKAVNRVAKSPLGTIEFYPEHHRRIVKAAARTNDAGEIDADIADCLVQVALFGKVVYG